MDANIRKISDEDFEQITMLIKKIWSIGLDYEREKKFGIVNGKKWHEWKIPELTDFLKKHRENVVVLTAEDGKIAGFASWTIHRERNIGEVTGIGIDPKYGGKGFGKMLLNYTLDRIKERNPSWIEVETGLNDAHAPARGLYEKAGFKPLMSSIRYYMEI